MEADYDRKVETLKFNFNLMTYVYCGRPKSRKSSMNLLSDGMSV